MSGADFIIVAAGHNDLIGAGHLTQTGHNVLVLEPNRFHLPRD